MKTAAQVRAEVDAAKVVAMNNFQRDWGTRDVGQVLGALRLTIPASGNPAQALRKAKHLVDSAIRARSHKVSSPAYEAGRAARRSGLSQDDNPHLAAPNKVGIRRPTDEQAASDWGCGFRDENDALHVAKHGRTPELRDFVSRRGRRRAR